MVWTAWRRRRGGRSTTIWAPGGTGGDIWPIPNFRAWPLGWRLLGATGLLTAIIVGATVFVAHYGADPFSDHAQRLLDVATEHLPGVSQLTASAEITRNLAYCGTTDPQQQLDLYLPKGGDTSARPLVVYVHGGGWSHSSKTDPVLRYYGPTFLEHGYIVASINYRLAPRELYPAQQNDVSCALAYLRTNAVRFGIDRGQIYLFGDSAGGQLVAVQALSRESRASIAGVIDLYGVADLAAQANAGQHGARIVRRLFGSIDPVAEAAASPVNLVTPSAPPFLVIHGAGDRIVSPTQSLALVQRLQEAGVPAKFISVGHAGHAFGPANGPRPSVPQLAQAMADFLDQYRR